MQAKPLVSIICTSKNGVQTIRRCIDSVLAQDYPHVEFVVQDGASTDGTLDILREYGDRIKLAAEPDTCSAEAHFPGTQEMCRRHRRFLHGR